MVKGSTDSRVSDYMMVAAQAYAESQLDRLRLLFRNSGDAEWLTAEMTAAIMEYRRHMNEYFRHYTPERRNVIDGY